MGDKMRDKLINYSIYFKGDYFKIKQAISKNTFIDKVIDLSEDIQLITILDKEYPLQLLRLDKPPFVLFCKGDISLLKSRCASVVGSRNNSVAGKEICHLVVRNIFTNYTVVSGLAYGIDSIAHQETLNMNGKTIAVIGSGFNHVYPQSNTPLSEEISNRGLLISEYPPNVKPERKNFPMRNRIIAGLSSILYVCEAAKNSGTKITAEMALEIGNDVCCASGDIYKGSFSGTNELLKDGAKIIEF